MSPAFLFDIGNVILSFDFSKAAERLSPKCRLSPEEGLREVAPLVDPFERGEMTPEQFIAVASNKMGYEGSAEEFRAAFEDIFDLNERVVELIESLDRRDHPLHLLSNTNRLHVPYFERTWPVFERFSGRIYSCDVGVMKPDPEIFRITIDSLDLDPGSTIYIDDLPANCEAGAEAGLRAIPYARERHDDLLAELERMSLG